MNWAAIFALFLMTQTLCQEKTMQFRLYCSIFACNMEYYFKFVWTESIHLFYTGNQRERALSITYCLGSLPFIVEQQFVPCRPHLHCEVKPVPKAVILTLTFVVTVFSAELTSRWRDRGLTAWQTRNSLSPTCFCLGRRWLTKCSGPSEADRCWLWQDIPCIYGNQAHCCINKRQKFLLVTRTKLSLRYGWSCATWR